MRNLVITLVAVLGMGGGGQVQAQAQAAEGQTATTVREGDEALTCSQMADEAATLSASMGDSGDGGLLGRLGGVARAGVAMVVPGAGLALAGADAVTSGGRERKEAKADAGRDRWNYLNGLYAGKGCGEAETAAAAEPATPSPPRSPAVVAAAPTAAPSIQPARLPLD